MSSLQRDKYVSRYAYSDLTLYKAHMYQNITWHAINLNNFNVLFKIKGRRKDCIYTYFIYLFFWTAIG